MQRITGSKTARSFLLFILAVFFLFDLHGACVLSECPQLSPVSSAEVLNAGTAGRISPIRIPEKVSLREKVSRSWESLNKKEAEHIEFLLIYCILFSFLLLSRTGIMTGPVYDRNTNSRCSFCVLRLSMVNARCPFSIFRFSFAPGHLTLFSSNPFGILKCCVIGKPPTTSMSIESVLPFHE